MANRVEITAEQSAELVAEHQKAHPYDKLGETGGTVRVKGEIRFEFDVHSAEMNVFSLTELKEAIEADPVGWFIDYYLGQTTVPYDEDGDELGDRANVEKYEVVSFDVRPKEETVETHLKTEVTEKYLVKDPDTVADLMTDDGHIPLPLNDPRP